MIQKDRNLNQIPDRTPVKNIIHAIFKISNKLNVNILDYLIDLFKYSLVVAYICIVNFLDSFLPP